MKRQNGVRHSVHLSGASKRERGTDKGTFAQKNHATSTGHWDLAEDLGDLSPKVCLGMEKE